MGDASDWLIDNSISSEGESSMLSRIFKLGTIACLLVILCVLGYAVSTNADGKGYKCDGKIWSEWDPSCDGHAKPYCSKKTGTLVGKSNKRCIQGDPDDYCQVTKTGSTMDGTGSCKWNQVGKRCENPSISTSIKVDDC